MASLITALGGRVEFVTIDKFIHAQRIYEAKLHITQMSAAVVADVRISDAVILALICDVPIFVAKDVLVAVA
jgi:bifunctional DNase/RNase